jgi:hypothetical protein
MGFLIVIVGNKHRLRGIRWPFFISVLVHICLLTIAYNQFAKQPSTSINKFPASAIEIELVETVPVAQSSSSPKTKEQSPPKPTLFATIRFQLVLRQKKPLWKRREFNSG